MATKTAERGVDRAFVEDFGRRWLDAWNSHQAERVLELMTEDIVYDDSAWPRTMRGHDQVREFLAHTWRAFPDLEFELVDGPYLSPDEPKAAIYWKGTATFTGPLDPPGFAPTGQRIEMEGGDFQEYHDGRVSRLRIVFDTTTSGRQIGAIPPHGSRAERFGAMLQKLAARRLRKSGTRV